MALDKTPQAARPHKPASFMALLRTLGSLRLAVVVLATLAAVLAVTTIVESKFGTEAAQRYVYQSYWFGLLLVVLGVNVAAAALARWPWRPRQVGFLVTHAGILVVLGGCLGTNWLAINGRLALQQGTQDDRIVQDDWVIQAKTGSGESAAAVQIPIGQPPRVGTSRAFTLGGKTCQVRLLEYLPDAEERAQVVEGGPNDPAAVLVEIDAGGRLMQQWLLADDQGRWSIRMPGFTLAAMSQPPAPPTHAGKGQVVVTVDGKPYEIDVEKALAGPVDVDGKTTLRVTGYFEHASVVERKIQEDPSAPVNPAVTLELVSGQDKDVRIVFAQYGDISEMGGMRKTNKPRPIKVSLKHAGAGSVVAIVPQADGLVLYEQDGGQTLQQVPLSLNKPVPLRKMQMLLHAKEFLPHARAATVMAPLPAGHSHGEPQPALQVEVAGGNWQQKAWLTWGRPAGIAAGDAAMDLVLQAREVELPFTLKLERFDVEEYPGTDRPAMFRSHVTLIDDELREQRTLDIEMNRPLEHRGWSFFQSSYSIDPQRGQRVSILSVSKDPGKPIVFIGSLLLVIGTVIYAIQRLALQGGQKTNGAASTNQANNLVESKHA